MLSSPLPSSQISRLKGLYKDLHEALEPLFPANHPVLVTFSLPLPPTPSPLVSAIIHLREALVALRKRCAPIRDTTIDQVIHQIDHRSPSTSTEELAQLLVDVIQSVLNLSVEMRDDYSNAVLATSSEQELVDMVARMAESEERRLVLQLWESEEAMRKAWERWMEGFHPANAVPKVQQKQLWILKLVESLAKPSAVTSKLLGPSRFYKPADSLDPGDPGPSANESSSPPNMLPPQFLLSGPTLFRLQNSLQALVVAASLKSLVPGHRQTTSSPAPPQSKTGDCASPEDWAFTKRIWALLELEIDADDDGPSETKVINLADEVVTAYKNALPPGVATLDPHLEQRLRSAVDRILRTNDSVYTLLQKRLLTALSMALLGIPTAEEHVLPKLQSGRSPHREGAFSSSPLQRVQRDIPVVAKGFEDPLIAKQCSFVASTLRRNVEWVERVWGDTIPQ